jgi:hypothetical protein
MSWNNFQKEVSSQGVKFEDGGCNCNTIHSWSYKGVEITGCGSSAEQVAPLTNLDETVHVNQYGICFSVTAFEAKIDNFRKQFPKYGPSVWVSSCPAINDCANKNGYHCCYFKEK